MDVFRPKPWLTPAQQVLHLESEGIKFELASKEEAACYLEANNNFFRINLFRKGFQSMKVGCVMVCLSTWTLECFEILQSLITSFVKCSFRSQSMLNIFLKFNC